MFVKNQVRHILRLRCMCAKLAVSRGTVYSWMNPKSRYFDESFPKPLRLGVKAVGWDSVAVESWIDSRDTVSHSSCASAGVQK